MISNYGRVKSYSKTYDRYYLIQLQPNKNNGRLYVTLNRGNKTKNKQVSRLVGFAFVPGYTEEKNTINHKDGNVQNNYYKNLEWLSQSENNKHAFDELKRTQKSKRVHKYKRIIYKEEYEFKTASALSRFLGLSETQTRRYLDEPEKHELRLVV
jgi:hypothetical protein